MHAPLCPLPTRTQHTPHSPWRPPPPPPHTQAALLPVLISAAHCGVVVNALDAHCREALRRGWALPRLEYEQGGAAGGAAAAAQQQQEWQEGQQQLDPGVPMRLSGFWPYWMDGRQADTVRNELALGGMALLTGPNMAGKSTVLRRCVGGGRGVACSSCCGLHALPLHTHARTHAAAFHPPHPPNPAQRVRGRAARLLRPVRPRCLCARALPPLPHAAQLQRRLPPRAALLVRRGDVGDEVSQARVPVGGGGLVCLCVWRCRR